MVKLKKRLGYSALLLVLVVILRAESADSYLNLLIRGDEHYYSGNYHYARDLYDSASVIRPLETASYIGLYHTALKLNQGRAAADYAERLYQLDSSVINWERRIFSQAFKGSPLKPRLLADSGLVEKSYGYDLAAQGYFQGGYLLEALRMTGRIRETFPDYPLIDSRYQAIESALNQSRPAFYVSNTAGSFSYDKHPVLRSGWYNGLEAGFSDGAHRLSVNWNEQHFKARSFVLPGTRLVSTIREEWWYKYHVPFTAWDSVETVSRDSGYEKRESFPVKPGEPLQRDFRAGYDYQILTGWNATLYGVISRAENDIWSEGFGGGIASRFDSDLWHLQGGISFGRYKFNNYSLNFQRTDSLYYYQTIWDSAYMNAYGNYEKDTVVYTYRNEYAVYHPVESRNQEIKKVLQLNFGSGLSYQGIYLGLQTAVRQIGTNSSWDWFRKGELAYTYGDLTLWGAYSQGSTFFFNFGDGRVLTTAVPDLKNGYETEITWRISRNWQLSGYYAFKEYQDYRQEAWLGGITWNLFRE